MKIYKLDKEEKELIKSVNRGEWTELSQKETLKYSQSAKEFMKKDVKINIRLNKNDLENIKLKAMQEGLPYQTLIGSILHKYAHRYKKLCAYLTDVCHLIILSF